MSLSSACATAGSRPAYDMQQTPVSKTKQGGRKGGREDRGGVLGLGEGRGECNFSLVLGPIYTEQLLLKFPVALHP